jgi:S-adenosylmethionine:diacylglycerol 3-amino-3-carboxypropyl transferase
MMKKRTSHIDAFLALPEEEKERQCREFDKEFVADAFKPLTPKMRARWERARRRGRPRIGKGAQPISLTVERSLLKTADRRAKSSGISRAELFARALRDFLAKAG